MAIFQKTQRTIGISDRMTLGGYTFDAQMVVSERNGSPAAIHCGRILVFQLTVHDPLDENDCSGDETIAYFEDGVWYQLPSDDFEEGKLARELMIEKWNKCEDVRKELEYEDSILSGKAENWITKRS